MIKLLLSDLKMASLTRPEGYYDEIVSRGRIETVEILILDEKVYTDLKKKFVRTIQPIALENWPFWAQALKMVAKSEDKGIGDVIARTIGDENSEAFKAWYKKTTGKDCGCAGRQKKWNQLYPLP